MKLLKSKIFYVVISSFLLGGLVTYLATDYMRIKNQLESNVIAEKPNVFGSTKQIPHEKKATDDPFARMDLMEKRMNRMFDRSLFDSVGFGLGDMKFSSFESDLNVTERENNDFKYIEIEGEGIEKETIQLNITDGIINISGEIKKTIKNEGQNTFSMSSYVSKFSRSFNIPYGVDETKVQIESKDSKIIIKFPKVRI